MITKMIYDRPLEYAWSNCKVHTITGELGHLAVPLTNVVETQGRYSLIAENTPRLQKTIYAAMEVAHDVHGVITKTIGGKRFIVIPVADVDMADKVFYIWEEALKRGESIVATTKYILEKLY